jgi:hypothetical protein
MRHREIHVPEELIEGNHTRRDRMDRLLELGSVIVLSLAVLATAWSGYHAARWSGEESRMYTEASALRVKSAEKETLAGQARIDDQLYFDGWLDAYDAGNMRLAAVYHRRFRPEFREVFRSWREQRPFSNPRAAPGPFYMPEYRPAELDHAAALETEADALFREGIEAKAHDDAFILSTVFFAAVMFFAGVCMRLEWWRLRVAVFGIGSVMLVGGIAWVLTLPVV